jgi:hypothetical protein
MWISLMLAALDTAIVIVILTVVLLVKVLRNRQGTPAVA